MPALPHHLSHHPDCAPASLGFILTRSHKAGIGLVRLLVRRLGCGEISPGPQVTRHGSGQAGTRTWAACAGREPAACRVAPVTAPSTGGCWVDSAVCAELWPCHAQLSPEHHLVLASGPLHRLALFPGSPVSPDLSVDVSPSSSGFGLHGQPLRRPSRTSPRPGLFFLLHPSPSEVISLKSYAVYLFLASHCHQTEVREGRGLVWAWVTRVSMVLVVCPRVSKHRTFVNRRVLNV